jgi:ubiquinol-cytochrome c reductase subunit 7
MARTGILAKVADGLLSWASGPYNRVLGSRLADYGLRYEDLYDPLLDQDVAEALRRLPDQEVVDRNARIKRAMDLSMKHEVLTGELRAQQTPFKLYMNDILEQVKAEKQERRQLNAAPLYQRSFP